jgi:hypothetical protein
VLDPGGVELFAPMLAAVLHHAPVEEITDLFASHQDPDIISSLGLYNLQRLQMSYNHLRPEERYYIDIELKKGTSHCNLLRAPIIFNMRLTMLLISSVNFTFLGLFLCRSWAKLSAVNSY